MHPYGVPASGENLANVIRHYGKTREVFILKSTHSKIYHWERTFGSVTNQHFDFDLQGHWLLHLSKEESG